MLRNLGEEFFYLLLLGFSQGNFIDQFSFFLDVLPFRIGYEYSPDRSADCRQMIFYRMYSAHFILF